MGRLNIFEKDEIIRKGELVKQSIFSVSKFNKGLKKVILKGVTLATALSIIMSSTAFAGIHSVDNWDDYKNAIIEDILKLDKDITITYTGGDKFASKEEIQDKIIQMYEEAEADSRLEGFHYQNIAGSNLSMGTIPNGDGTFSLTRGVNKLTYKNSAEDMIEVDERISSALGSIISNDMNDYEKVKAVYDYVLDAFYYQANEDDRMAERNLLLGLDGNGVVCDAYTMLMNKMLTELGYNNLMVTGESNGGPHIWNLVEIEGEWYNIDSTWGDVDVQARFNAYKTHYGNQYSDEVYMEYAMNDVEEAKQKHFLTSDEILKETHTWNPNGIPQANEIYVYNKPDADIEKLNNKIIALDSEILDLITQYENLLIANVDVNGTEFLSLMGQINTSLDAMNLLKAGLEEIEVLYPEKDISQIRDKLSQLETLLNDKNTEINNYRDIEDLISAALANLETAKTREELLIVKGLIDQLTSKGANEGTISNLNDLVAQIEEAITEGENVATLLEELFTALENAEAELTEENIAIVREKLLALEGKEVDEQTLTEINNRITVVEDTIEANKTQEAINLAIDELENMVALAETDMTEEGIANAKSKIEELRGMGVSEEIISSYLSRITAVEDIIKTPVDPEDGETPVDPEDGETPVDPEEGETPVDPEEGETPVDPEEGETPVDPEEGETPVDPEEGETPVDPEEGETPVDPEEGETPVDPEDGETPVDPEEGETPVDPEEGETPVDPEEGETPVDPEEGETPVDPEEGETPVDPEEGETPVDPEDGETPVDPEEGETPVDPEEGGTPVDPEEGETPVDPEEGETPVDPEEGETPVDPEEGETPVDPEVPEVPETPETPIIPERPKRPRPSRPEPEDRPSRPVEKPVEKVKVPEIVAPAPKTVTPIEFSKEKSVEVKEIIKEILKEQGFEKMIEKESVKIMVNGKEIKPDVSTFIFKEDKDAVYVPIRFIAEALGFEVNWNNRRVFMGKSGKGIIIDVDNGLYYLNGEGFKMELAPEIKDGRTFVDMNFIIEILETAFNFTNVNGEIMFNIE